MSTHRTSSKAIATLFLIVGIIVLLVCSAAIAAAKNASTGGRGMQTGSTRVDFIDEYGHLAGNPVIAGAGAYPGMPEQRYPFRLQNTGTLGADFTVTTSMPDSGDESLDDVLLVTVTDESGTIVYRGTASDLSFGGRVLSTQSRSLLLAVAWPAATNDNRYQGQSFSFTLRADVRPTQ